MLIRRVLVSLAMPSVALGDVLLTLFQQCQRLMPSGLHTTTGEYLLLLYHYSS